jgi:hypothetical protein
MFSVIRALDGCPPPKTLSIAAIKSFLILVEISV